MRLRSAAVITFLLTGAATAQNVRGLIPTATGDFLKFCHQDVPRCTYTIGYTYIGMDYSQVDALHESCVPRRVPNIQLAREVIAWIEQRPERHSEDRTVVITDALAALYPPSCGPEP
jgi:hypothetical protein